MLVIFWWQIMCQLCRLFWKYRRDSWLNFPCLHNAGLDWSYLWVGVRKSVSFVWICNGSAHWHHIFDLERLTYPFFKFWMICHYIGVLWREQVLLPPSMTIEQNNNFLSMLIAGEQQPLWERSSKSAKLFRCDICGKRFTSDFAKRRHEKNLHSTIDHRPRPYSCKYCNLKFIEKHHMKMHVVRVHSNVGWD